MRRLIQPCLSQRGERYQNKRHAAEAAWRRVGAFRR